MISRSTSKLATAQPARRPRRVEAEDVRRGQLIGATIAAIAERGYRAATVGAIAEEAGVSVGLVAFYFGDKDGLLEATLRHLVKDLGRTHLKLLARASTPRDRIMAVVEANLGPGQFQRQTASVWLAFWAEVPVEARFARIQRIYARRMVSNLSAAWGQLVPRATARQLAEATAALIDGCWLRSTLALSSDGAEARELVERFVDTQIALIELSLLKDNA